MSRADADAPPTIRLALTSGEPSGIGPDLCATIAQQDHPAELVVIGDAFLLRDRAAVLGLPLNLLPFDQDASARPQRAGQLTVLHTELRAPKVKPGALDPGNAPYVIETLAIACDGCRVGSFAAMVTAPVHKGVINDADIPFSGHTEWLAERCGGSPVMLLATDDLRVALATTHLPLADVPKALNRALLTQVISTLNDALIRDFGISRPRTLVCGLNPHAGEGGHLGQEEITLITPVIESLTCRGLMLEGPVPADTAFTPARLSSCDAVLAMYHDQGLPVLKHRGFGRAVNITLGLPIIRTSVDHGTALDLAGSGRADPGSLETAIDTALLMAKHRAKNHGQVSD